ncbi:hypothetical protein BX666DRAFT_1386138 [Dichotomocladium elegans]|nr:hypothetical protein BX666DRAFT_1386138 [Dichotomocladium elegans]
MNDMFTQCEQGLNMHREAMSRLEYELSNSEEEKMYLTTRLQMAQNKSEELAGKLAETENTYAALAESYKELMIERKALEKQWQQSCQLEKMLEQNMESLQADLTKMLDAKKQYDKEMAEKLQTLAEAAKVEKRSIGEYVQCMESKIEDGHRRTQNVELQLGQAQREIESLRSEVRTAANETLAAIQRVSRQEQEEMRSQKEMMRQERNEFAASIALLVAKVETSANKLEKAMEDQDLQIKKQEEHCKTQPSIVTEPQTEGRQKMTLGIDKHVTVCSLIGAAMYAGLAFICI